MNEDTARSEKGVLQQTRNWLETVIIQHNFCPFAQHEFANDRIHFEVCSTSDMQSCLELVITECVRLDCNRDIATTLIIFTDIVSEFEAFLDLVDMANDLLRLQGYEGIYQLAHFHPDYRFAGAENNDAANYTNRSPWPMLHLLRETDVEQAITYYKDTAKIPERNIDQARQLGRVYFETILENIKAEK